ncbi:MAG: aminoacyl-tRNA hydrolase [Candidatus Omnitrophica bacterium]|nr:aminoacyl-tRNA hydrolase [Candidatus Omnitrophota bacterium]
MKLIVGLGNPGWRYRFTRHNAGAMAVEQFAKAYRIRIGTRRYGGMTGEGLISRHKAVLLIPLTYMNLSGESVRAARRLVRDLSDIMIVYDDKDLELGTLRFRPAGSSGGHKGLASIIEALGSESIPRLRIGIHPQEEIGDTADFVLRPFMRQERLIVNDVFHTAVLGLETWIGQGMDACMTAYNRKKA